MHKCDCGPASECTYPKCEDGILVESYHKEILKIYSLPESLKNVQRKDPSHFSNKDLNER